MKNGDCVLLAVTVKTVENGDDCDDIKRPFYRGLGLESPRNQIM